MKKYIFIILMVLPFPVYAANIAVTPSGSGNESGSDWNNAKGWDSIDGDEFVRGNTYYLAEGTFGGKTYNTANSGSTYITIKKATDSDYGGLSNWASSMGDGQSNIGSITIASDYWVFDGARRDEGDWTQGSSYGFRVSSVTTNAAWYPNVADYVTVQYSDVGGAYSLTYAGPYGTGFYFGGFSEIADHWLISRNYIHNVDLVGQMAGVDTITWEYNWAGLSWSKEIIRGQNQASNITMRHNIFKDGCRNDGSGGEVCTAEIALFSNAPYGGSYDNFMFYGNVLWKTFDTGNNSGCVLTGTPDYAPGSKAYNNTIVVAQESGECGIKFYGGDAEVRDNIIYVTASGTTSTYFTATTTSNNVTYDYNDSVPFVNAGSGNFHLTSDGGAGTGYTLSSPYATDMDGVARGGDGNWDIGAYEYGSGALPDTTPPAAPQGLTVN